jgi:hypothetical protein
LCGARNLHLQTPDLRRTLAQERIVLFSDQESRIEVTTRQLRSCSRFRWAVFESNQICGLERRTARGGRDSIDHAPGAHDDIANAAAGALVRVAGEPNALDIWCKRRGMTTMTQHRPLTPTRLTIEQAALERPLAKPEPARQWGLEPKPSLSAPCGGTWRGSFFAEETFMTPDTAPRPHCDQTRLAELVDRLIEQCLENPDDKEALWLLVGP